MWSAHIYRASVLATTSFIFGEHCCFCNIQCTFILRLSCFTTVHSLVHERCFVFQAATWLGNGDEGEFLIGWGTLFCPFSSCPSLRSFSPRLLSFFLFLSLPTYNISYISVSFCHSLCELLWLPGLSHSPSSPLLPPSLPLLPGLL